MAWDEDDFDDYVEPGAEEKQFVMNTFTGMTPEQAALNTLVPADASPAEARRQANLALRDKNIHLYTEALMEQAGISEILPLLTLKKALKARKKGIAQASGSVVDLGPDWMSRVGAAKILLQARGQIGGGVAPEKKTPTPFAPQINVIFNERSIDDDEPDDDGSIIDVEYTANDD